MKILSALIVMLLVTGPLISQTYQSPTSDSSLIANKDLRKAAILIEQGKGCKVELALQLQRIDLLTQRIGLKDSVIDSHVQNAKSYEGIIANYKAMQINYEQTMMMKDKQFAKALTKQKVKAAFITSLLALAIGYLAIK